MSIRIGWLVENRVLYAELEGAVSQSTLKSTVEQLTVLLDQSSESCVHLVSNFSQLESIPLDIPSLASISMSLTNHPKMEWAIMVDMHQNIFQQIASIVGRITRAKYHFTDSLENSIAFIAYKDESLCDLSLSLSPQDVTFVWDSADYRLSA